LDMVPVGSVAVVYPFNSNFVPNPTIWQAISDFRFRQPGTALLVPSGPSAAIAFSPALSYARDTLTARVLITMAQGHIPAESPNLRSGLLAQFRQWDVQSFLAFPGGTPNATQAIALFDWLFGRPPNSSTGGAFVWYHLQG
jgi:hypothetical protein